MTIPLGRLVSDFPEDKIRAQLAYAQSADLVHYLIRSYGSDAFRDFVIALGRGYRFGYASRTILGEDFLALEERWHRHLRTRYTWIPLLTSTGSLWFLASLVFLAHDLLARVGLADRLEHYPAQLSGGEQQRVGLARAFANRPTILFADEPTGSLDSETGAGVIDLLAELNAEAATTMGLVTHDPALASRAQRVIRLRAGAIISDERTAA